jgi:hypothetical protein
LFLSVSIGKKTNCYGNESFRIFGAMTNDFVSTYQKYIARNVEYANFHNYSYEIFIGNSYESFGDARGLKIVAVNEYLTGTHTLQKIRLTDNSSFILDEPVDWFVFIDADAFLSELQFPLSELVRLATMIPDNISKEPTRCEFIAQDHMHIINSGVWMIRNSSWSKHFVSLWMQNFVKNKAWIGDQGPLQDVVLSLAANYTHSPTPYDESCAALGARNLLAEANYCYRDKMNNEYNLRFHSRKFDNFCLVPPTGFPFRFHIHQEFKRGDLVNHHKKMSSRDFEFRGVSIFNYTNCLLSFVPGTLIRAMKRANDTVVSSNSSSNQIYLVFDDKRKHLIQNRSASIGKPGLISSSDVLDVLAIHNTYFDSLFDGNLIP